MNLPAFTMKVAQVVGSLAMFTTLLGAGSAQPSQVKPASEANLSDGIYLYGEVPQPNQVRQGYLVFQHTNGEVVGAFYYPRSEFQCFRGNLDNTEMNIQAIATANPVRDPNTVELNSLYQLEAVTENDRRILSLCRQEIASEANSLETVQ